VNIFFRQEISLKYISSWKIPPGTMNAAIKRFLESGGAPPEGIKMLGRLQNLLATAPRA
jgi:hypothetical protein